jgi:hypothetical protein
MHVIHSIHIIHINIQFIYIIHIIMISMMMKYCSKDDDDCCYRITISTYYDYDLL